MLTELLQGSGGGPQESNTTAFLVRSIAQNWHKGSVVAVDGGVHLSAITRILKESLPSSPPSSLPHTLTSGPFAGLSLPHRSADANAGYITSSLIESYLITHTHLDHIAGFVINTAGPPGVRPKKLAGLPGTIRAFKTHIFNNIIWPNLSDENNGAGLVTFLRLVEGGSPALGDGEDKGYSEICDGLLIKVFGVSHGHCIENHPHRGSTSNASGGGGVIFAGQDPAAPVPTFAAPGPALTATAPAALQPVPTSRQDFISAAQATPRRRSLLSQSTTFGSGGTTTSAAGEQEKVCVYDSSAYFIQDQEHHREVLFFGDVEPDSLSLSPRNLTIWREAAPKIAAGTLAAIFIECSYENSRSNDRLFGHLKPVFVIEELSVLATEVAAARAARYAAAMTSPQDATRKRKRLDEPDGTPRSAPRQSAIGDMHHQDPHPDEPVSPKTFGTLEDAGPPSTSSAPAIPSTSSSKTAGRGGGSLTPHTSTPTHELSLREAEGPRSPLSLDVSGSGGGEQQGKRQLEGLKVIIIHVKEKLSDERDVGETIPEELLEHEKEAQLGCEFIMARSGQSFYL